MLLMQLKLASFQVLCTNMMTSTPRGGRRAPTRPLRCRGIPVDHRIGRLGIEPLCPGRHGHFGGGPLGVRGRGEEAGFCTEGAVHSRRVVDDVLCGGVPFVDTHDGWGRVEYPDAFLHEVFRGVLGGDGRGLAVGHVLEF